MITINNKFKLGSMVYIISDDEQLKRQIISIEVYPDGSHSYEVACGERSNYCFEVELSEEKCQPE